MSRRTKVLSKFWENGGTDDSLKMIIYLNDEREQSIGFNLFRLLTNLAQNLNSSIIIVTNTDFNKNLLLLILFFDLITQVNEIKL